MIDQVSNLVKDNKATIIKVGGIVLGVVLGAIVGNIVSGLEVEDQEGDISVLDLGQDSE